jgi:pimeloyl-ACP methyl ester carboxylesterase
MLFLILIFFFLLAINSLKVCASDLLNLSNCSFKGKVLYTETYNYQNNGEAIIFLHGLCGNHIDGSFLYNDRNKYMTISMDMPNHGQSGKYEILTWDIYIDSVKAVIDYYDIKKVHFVGHSLGADTAMMYTYKYPDNVADIVLLDRSYYNFSDVEKYSFTSSFYKIIEYNKNSGVDFKSFNDLIDMSVNNDIKKTWNINKDVLLLAANPHWPISIKGEPNIIEYISMMKKKPIDFGISIEQADSLPDLTLDNLYSYMEFLKTKISEFTLLNQRFFVIQTPFEHAMVNNENAKTELLKYVLEFIDHNDKNISIENINKMMNEIKEN